MQPIRIMLCVGSASIREQVSVVAVRSATAATWQVITYEVTFERDVIVSAREMGHSISEVTMQFGFSLTTISRYPVEHQISDSGVTGEKP